MSTEVPNMQIARIDSREQIPYELLLLSDDTTEAIDKNLQDGELYIATINKKLAGSFILKKIDADTIEIKNIAVSEDLQGKGIGTALLQYIIQQAKERDLKKVIVGTCDQCRREIEFYEKSGFKLFSIKKNFFIENYKMPIYENSIQIKDMMMLQFQLNNEL